MRRPYSPLTPEQQQELRHLQIGSSIFPAALDSVSVYVHIPFCSSRCRYCDFYFETGWSSQVMNRTLDTILAEARFFMQHTGQPNIRTVYIGGGTPSVIPPEQLRGFLGSLAEILGVSDAHRTHALEEWSFEANPENITPQLLAVLAEAGGTRLSIGIQTFSDPLLRTLTRRAYRSTAVHALELVREQWDTHPRRYSIDLISGIPGQTAADIREDLQYAARFRPGHISHYTLTVEPETPLEQMITRGDLDLPDQDDLWETMHAGLGELGYRQYEVSNYARPGQESRHNLSYWRMQPYIGIGPGAVGTLLLRDTADRVFPARLTNPDLFRYSAPSSTGWQHEIEPLSARDLFVDYCITGLRTSEGIQRERARRIFGEAADGLLDGITRGQDELFDRDDPGYLRCTPAGRLLLNRVIRTGLHTNEAALLQLDSATPAWPASQRD